MEEAIEKMSNFNLEKMLKLNLELENSKTRYELLEKGAISEYKTMKNEISELNSKCEELKKSNYGYEKKITDQDKYIQELSETIVSSNKENNKLVEEKDKLIEENTKLTDQYKKLLETIKKTDETKNGRVLNIDHEIRSTIFELFRHADGLGNVLDDVFYIEKVEVELPISDPKKIEILIKLINEKTIDLTSFVETLERTFQHKKKYVSCKLANILDIEYLEVSEKLLNFIYEYYLCSKKASRTKEN